MPQRQESEEKMKELVMQLQGKSVREFAKRLVTGYYKIEREALNRYRVYDAQVNNEPEPVALIDRRSFVLLDKELYRLQSKDNRLQAGIENALNCNKLEFCVRKSYIDTMSFKLIAKTLSYSKVQLEHVESKIDNYIIRFSLVEAVSERDLTDKEQAIAAMFTNANAAAGNPETEKTALPAPETTAAVDTTAKEIPEK